MRFRSQPWSTARSRLLLQLLITWIYMSRPAESFAQADPQAPRTFVATQGWVCAISPREELYCKLLGRGEGKPPNGLQSDLPTFERVAGLPAVTEVDERGKYICALGKRGEVQCWGCPNEHDCSLWPGPIALPEPAQHIAVSVSGACALLHSGIVQCWGVDEPNSSRQREPRWYEKPAPVPLTGSVKQVSALGRGYCALHGGGSISCWAPGVPPVRIEAVTHATALATGLSFGCAIADPQRSVQCWGFDEASLRRAEENPSAATPVLQPTTKIAGLQQVVQLAAGNLFAVALTQDGSAYHFGLYHEPGLRQFGHAAANAGSVDERKRVRIDLNPFKLALPQKARSAIVGNHFACFDLESGQRMCERALARTRPFDMREVWNDVRFEPRSP